MPSHFVRHNRWRWYLVNMNNVIVRISSRAQLTGRFGVCLRHLSDTGDKRIFTVHTDTYDSNFVRGKINELVTWYEQVTGMDEVRLMQNRVIEAQDRLASSQETRRRLASELIGFQTKLKEIHAELNTTARGEDRYLQLITEEHKLLQDERRIKSEFAIAEREERDSFSLLSSRLKDSHEKERAHAERTKYWSIIGSVVGTIVGIAGSSINNELKMRELRNIVRESYGKNNSVLDSVPTMSSLLKEVSSSLTGVRTHLTQTTGKQNELVEYVRRIGREVEDLKKATFAPTKVKGGFVVPSNDLDIKYMVIGASILAVTISLVYSMMK